MEPGGREWAEAAARVQADLDADLRADAREVLAAEAARTRLIDRIPLGPDPVRIDLRCGELMAGRMDPSIRVDGHLGLSDVSGRRVVVAIAAVVAVHGSRRALRGERLSDADGIGAREDAHAVRLTTWLRDRWAIDEPMGVLDARGRWSNGRITWVGADHVELKDARGHGAGPVSVIGLAAVEAWAW